MGTRVAGAAWRRTIRTAGVRAGARIRAQRPRPGGPAATPAPGVVAGALPLTAAATLGTWKIRRARRNARSLRRGGPVRWPTKRHCGKRAAETVPVRMTGGCHQAERLAPPGKACHTCAGAYLHSTPCGRPVPVPVWLRSSAASVSTQHCSWQPSWLPHWELESGGGPATATPQQACAVRMACGRPSAVMPLRNARR